MSGVAGRSVGVAVPAAGMGRRMGGVRKAWLELAGRPVLEQALRPFLERPDVVAVCVALAAADATDVPEWLLSLDRRVTVVQGGATRAESVALAVEALPEEVDVVLVHDAARPLVPSAVIQRVVEQASAGTGAVAGLPATDTLKRVDETRRILSTPSRDGMWRAQTPQGFPAALLRRAIAALRDDPTMAGRVTDDASLVEAIGGEVVMVMGSPRNLKVTHPADLPLAEWYAAHPEREG